MSPLFNPSRNRFALMLVMVAAVALLCLPDLAAMVEPQPEPAATVRAELKTLAFLAGTWSVDSNFRLGDGRRERTEATSTFEIDLDGAVIRERYRGTRDGEPFAALGVLCYSEIWQRLQHAWLDADHGVSVYEGVEGHAGFAAGDFVFEHHLDLRGRSVVLQRGITEIDENSFVVYSRRSADERATWRETWRATYRRVAGD